MIENIKKSWFLKLIQNQTTAWAVLCIGLMLTFFVWSYSNKYFLEDVEGKFDIRVANISKNLDDKLEMTEHILWGGVAFLNAHEHFNRATWQVYVSSLQTDDHWLGFEGIGLSVPVVPSEKALHIESMQDEGFPSYTITPGGEREAYTPIISMEPSDFHTQHTFGNDLWSNPSQREAMVRARDSGLASISGVTTLEHEVEEGWHREFSTYLPLYTNGMPLENVADRMLALRGWVVGVFFVDDVLGGASISEQPYVAYEIFDTDEFGQSSLIFDSNGFLFDSSNNYDILTKTTRLEIQGRIWTIQYTYDYRDDIGIGRHFPLITLVVGLLLSLLLFYIIFSLSSISERAEAIAATKTVRLEEEKLKAESAQRNAEDTNRAKSEFIATVSHELRSPLTSIKGVLGLIKAKAFDKDPDKLYSMVNIAYANCDRLNLLITDILNREKLEAGMMDFHMHPTDLSALVKEAVEANRGYGFEYGVSFVCTDIKEPLMVCADSERLMQVMANLLSNAAKFSPRGEKVEASVVRNDKNIRIAVKDYGRGIPEEAQETLFDRFTQVNSSNLRTKGGTGLGLSIIKEIVNAHNGIVSFTSEVGKGTTFYVDLPEILAE